jgi:hypothetical protein
MKSTFFGAAALLALMCSFSSCKKDYTCTCTGNGTSFSYELKDVSKSDAETACNVYAVGGLNCSL